MSNRSVLVALTVMEEIASQQPIGVSDLARRLALSKTTVHRSLLTLAEAGWIEASDDRRALWSLSVKALSVAGRAVDAQHGLRGVAVPVMEDLRRATEETIHLLVRERTHVVLIERLDGIKAVRVFNPVGGRGSIFRTSSGKAILAALPASELERYIEILRGRVEIGAQDPDAFLAELALVKARGFAMNLGSNQPDVHAVAAAILDAAGAPIAAVTVSAPPERLPEAICERIGPLVVDAARRISVGLRARR